MAKASKVDPCMFCGDLPCSCGGPKTPPKKKVTPSKSKPKPSVPTVESEKDTGPSTPPTVDIKAAMKSRRPALKTQPTEQVQLRVVEVEVPAYDDELSTALRALKPILHQSEIVRYREILVDPKTRAAAWKRRNSEH